MTKEVKRPTVRVDKDVHIQFKSKLVGDPEFRNIQDFLSRCIQAYNDNNLNIQGGASNDE